jgi:hypothetical protein
VGMCYCLFPVLCSTMKCYCLFPVDVQVFEDAYKSQLSIIILDDIER